jgi:uncharacterized protein DUF4154
LIASTTVARAPWPASPLSVFAAPLLRRLASSVFVACLLGYLLAIGAWSAPSPHGDDAAPGATSIKAAFVYRFLGFVEWPARALQSAHAPIVIGVLGADALARELEEVVANRRVDERAIEVRRVDAAHALDGVNVLFVGEHAADALPALAEPAARASVLIVSDFAGALDRGSVINLLVVDNRVRFEVSLDAASRSALRLSSRLLGVAYRVLGQP